MGARGTRKKKEISSSFREPDLLIQVDDIRKKAIELGCYDGDQLDLEKLINFEFKEIQIRYAEMPAEASGSLSYDKNNEKWVISINSDQNRKRQKFTLAHEFGHFILHKNKQIDYVDTIFFRNTHADSIEIAANDFAGKLLIPEDRLRNYIDNEGIKNIGTLAQKFDVSSAAMKYRVISLGYKMKENA